MKKFLLGIPAFLISVIGIAQTPGQWVLKPTPLTGTITKYVEKFEIKNKDLIWGHARAFVTTNRIRTVVRSVDEGNTWKVRTVGGVVSNLEIANVTGVDSNIAFASLYPPTASLTNQGIYRTKNGGVSWSNTTAGKFNGTSFVNWVHFWDAKHGVAMGDPKNGYFEIYTTSDTANTWVRVDSAGNNLIPFNAGEYGIVNLFATAGDSTIYFGTQYGRVLRSDNYGKNWVACAIPSVFKTTAPTLQQFTQIEFKNQLEGVLITPITNIAAAGVDTVNVTKTFDGGITWNVTSYSGSNWWSPSHISYVPGTNKIVTAGGSLISTTAIGAGAKVSGTTISYDNGNTFEVLDSTSYNYTVNFLNDSTGYASGEVSTGINNGIFKWENGIVFVKTKSILSTNNEVAMYPNPTSSHITIRVSAKYTTVEVFNVLGKRLESQIVNDGKLMVDVSAYNAGTYFVQLTNQYGKTTRKFIKE